MEVASLGAGWQGNTLILLSNNVELAVSILKCIDTGVKSSVPSVFIAVDTSTDGDAKPTVVVDVSSDDVAVIPVLVVLDAKSKFGSVVVATIFVEIVVFSKVVVVLEVPSSPKAILVVKNKPKINTEANRTQDARLFIG